MKDIIDFVKLRYKYLKENNPKVPDKILQRKAREQMKCIQITLPKTEALKLQQECVEREIVATRKLAKMMSKRKNKPLVSILRWAEILEEVSK